MKSKIFRKIFAVSLSALMLMGTAVSVSAASFTQSIQTAAVLTEGKFSYSINDDGTASITKYNGNEKNVVIPSVIGGKKVTVIGDKAFEENKTLVDIKIPDGVTRIGFNAFSWCTSITSVTLPNTVTYVGDGAFNGCTSMTYLSLPNSLVDIEQFAFASCYSLKVAALPDYIKRLKRSIFEGCRSLKTVRLPSNVERIYDNAFGGCSSLVSVYVPEKATKIFSLAFRDCSELRNFTIAGKDTEFDPLTFENCSLLTIYGVKGGVTESNAKKYNIPFSTKKAPAVSLSTLSSDSIDYGESVTLKASAINGTAPYQYAVYFRSADSQTWIRACSYSKNNSIAVTPRSVGKNIIRLKIKDADGKITNTDYELQVRAKLTNNSKISKSTAKSGEEALLTCKASGSKGYLYSVSVRKGKYAEWQTVSGYSSTSSFKITQNSPATYFYKVTVKDSYGHTSEKTLPIRFTR